MRRRSSSKRPDAFDRLVGSTQRFFRLAQSKASVRVIGIDQKDRLKLRDGLLVALGVEHEPGEVPLCEFVVRLNPQCFLKIRFGVLETYLKNLEVDPNHAFTLDAIASLLARSGRFDEAYRHARHLVDVAGRFPQAQFTLARVAAAAGDVELARAQCDEALRLDPNFAPAQQLKRSLAETP